MSKLLVVIGATGKQGGSVISSVLADSKASATFKLRGVTRDTSKPASTALAAKGVEMVSADLNDKVSLSKAFEGAYAVFSVTDYWATMSMDTEIKQGKNMADAAKEAGVEHYVASVLINTTKSTNGALTKIEHFDGKAAIADYIRSINLPSSFYLPGFYMSNLPGQAIRKDDASGKYILALPSDADAPIPLIDIAADTGKYVKAILMNRDATLGKDILGAAKYTTPNEIIEEFARVFPKDGEGITYQTIPGPYYVSMLEGFGMPKPAAEELLENMILLNKEYGYYGGADLAESNAILAEKPVSIAEFLKAEPAFKDLQ